MKLSECLNLLKTWIYLNLYPVLLARSIQYRVEVYSSTARVSVKASYYSTRTEFQSTYKVLLIYSFLGILNDSVLHQNDIEEYFSFHLMSVPTYQIHRHQKSCK